MTQKTKFIVWGTQRTGTIFLTRMLDSHPDILCLGEAFQNTDTPCHQDSSIIRYDRYIKQSIFHRLCNHIFREYPINKYLDYVYSLRNTSAIGFKLMLNQHEKYPCVLDRLKKDNAKIVHIQRENILKTHISAIRAKKTGVFFSTDSIVSYKSHIPCKNLINDLISLEAKNTRLKDIINSYQFEQITVSYENLTSNLSSESSNILSFLGVDNTISLTTQSCKITSDHLENSVENYKELVNTLRNSKYESLLQ